MKDKFGQDFEFLRFNNEVAPSAGYMDARTDQQWVRSVETLVARNDLQELWHLAQKAPPIWTVRILKYLNKQSWLPEHETQLDFFQQLTKYASACNEYDLPSPKIGTPKSFQLSSSFCRKISSADNSKMRITAARITADGEQLFVVDDKCSVVDVWLINEARQIGRIRTDIKNNKQFATVAFAVSRYGDRMALLQFEQKTKEPALIVYTLANGEVTSESWLKFENKRLGSQIPRLAFNGSSEFLTVYSAQNRLEVWDVSRKTKVKSLTNVGKEAREEWAESEQSTDLSGKAKQKSDPEFVSSPYTVSSESSLTDWMKYGRWAMAQEISRGVELSNDAKILVAKRKNEINVWQLDTNDSLLAELASVKLLDSTTPVEPPVSLMTELGSTDKFTLSANGKFVIRVTCVDNRSEGKYFKNYIECFDMSNGGNTIIATCSDPALQLTTSYDSEILAAAMSHGQIILFWHLPDGRNLGRLQGLERDILLDLRMTDGGSVVAVTRNGLVQIWESDGNGNAWPWSAELVQITHQPIDSSSVLVLRQAQEMRRRGWLSIQESNLLDLALALMQQRLSLDIEVEFDSQLPGDVFDIEIE